MYVGDTQDAAATFVHAYGFDILIPAGIDLKGSARAADHGVTTQGIPAAMSRRSPRQLYVDLRGCTGPAPLQEALPQSVGDGMHPVAQTVPHYHFMNDVFDSSLRIVQIRRYFCGTEPGSELPQYCYFSCREG